MASESALDATIDRLYQLPLNDFVAARNEAAREFGGEEARAIRALGKPNTVAWALNKVYWSSRPDFDALVRASAQLREAQAAGLLGRPVDLRGAVASHRKALAAAVNQALAILERAGHDAGPDAGRSLTAAFEALPWEEPAGRLVRPPSPIGFGALAGMPAGIGLRAQPPPEATPERPRPPRNDELAARRKLREAERSSREEAAEQARQRALAASKQLAREALESARREAAAAAERMRSAERRLAEGRKAEQAAREQLEAARRGVREAELALRTAGREAAAAGAAAQEAERSWRDS